MFRSVLQVRWFMSLFLFFSSLYGYAQPGGEAGVLGGVSYYLGEYNPSRHFKDMGVYYGAFYRYNMNDRFAFRLNFGMSELEYTNEDLLDMGGMQYPTSFRTSIQDITCVVEFNFRSFMIPKTEKSSWWSPYLYTGIGFMMAKKGGGMNIPLGAGVKFNLSGHMALGVEWSARKLFSDKLDGLDDPWKTGESNLIYNKDWVFVTGITLSYRFPYEPECRGYE